MIGKTVFHYKIIEKIGVEIEKLGKMLEPTKKSSTPSTATEPKTK